MRLRGLAGDGRPTIATRLLIAAGSLVVMALGFLGIELAVRLAFPQRCAQVRADADRVELGRSFLAPCVTRQRRGDQEYLVPVPAGPDRRGEALPLDRPPGITRIAVIGESSADLLAKQLSDIAADPRCGGSYQVLNCAQPGSALEHVARRFDEVLAYQPNAVVLVFGHNIYFQFPLDDGALHLQGLRARSCLLSQLAPSAPPPDDDSLDARLAALDQFLRHAAASARARGVALAITTVAANLWLPPGAGPGDTDDPRFLQARFLEARGRRAEAIEVLEALVAERDRPYWHYQLGEQLARAGNADGRAARELHLAVDGDTLRTRAPQPVNDLLRSVAAQEHVLLRDTEAAVAARAPGGLPGWESFVDNCHLLPAAFDIEAAAVLALLHDTGLPTACDGAVATRSHKGLADVLVGVFDLAALGPPDVTERWYTGLALAVESWVTRDPKAADADVQAFLDSPRFTAARGEERSAKVLLAIAEGYARAGRRDRALALNEQARRADGAAAWVQKGLFDVQAGDDTAAREDFAHALQIDGSRVDARKFLALLSEASGTQ
jgi:tetratricopeptide (TPR) repeat protein